MHSKPEVKRHLLSGTERLVFINTAQEEDSVIQEHSDTGYMKSRKSK